MLSQLLSILSRILSPAKSAQTSSKPSESSASLPAPSPESSNSLLTQITKQLRIDEGEILHAYQDHLGYWTIGVGRLIDKRRGGGISEDESAYLLRNDILTRKIALETKIPWIKKLDTARQGVLLNMAFQLGIAGLLNFRNTLAKVEAGNYEGAAVNMLKSKWAKQTPNRAKRMAEQMRTGQWQFG